LIKEINENNVNMVYFIYRCIRIVFDNQNQPKRRRTIKNRRGVILLHLVGQEQRFLDKGAYRE